MMIKWLTVNWFDSNSLGLMLVVNSKWFVVIILLKQTE